MSELIYPSIYYKYPLVYNFNPDLYGSTVINPNTCEFVKYPQNPFLPNVNESGDLSKCRFEAISRCPQKPYYGGDATPSFPRGLKFQELPYFQPNINESGMLTLKRPKNHRDTYTRYLGF